MRKEEFVFVSGEDEPKIMYTPYVYAVIKDFSNFYIVENRKGVQVIFKEGKKNKNKKKRRKK